MSHTLTVTFNPAVTDVAAKSGTSGGSSGAHTSGTFTITGENIDLVGGRAVALWTDDTGFTGMYGFAFDPDTQTIDVALLAALQAQFTGSTVTLTYV
jgi:hypothetical protein